MPKPRPKVSEVEKLEIGNKKMEARLKAFKMEMERQRSQRNLWKSSTPQRPIARYGEEFLKKVIF
jgi:hypothetical protein